MIVFVIAEVPGLELSLHHSHSSSWGTIFGQSFTVARGLAVNHWTFTEISALLTGTYLAWFLSQLS